MKISKRKILCASANKAINAAESYKDIHGVMGTPGDIWTSAELRKYWKDEHMNDPVMSEYDSFDSWFRDTVSQLEPVNTSTSINATTDADTERYLHTLIGDVESALANEVDSVNFEQDNNNLYVTITYMSMTQEYAFGFSELTMLWDSIDEDASYIVNTILQGLDTMG